jgi:hypothetical protein
MTALKYVASLAISLPVMSMAENGMEVGKPNFKVGEVITYTINRKMENRTGEEINTITSVNDNEVKVRNENTLRDPLVVDAVWSVDGGVVVTEHDGSKLSPPSVRLKFPMTVGLKWDSKYEANRPDGMVTRTTLDVEVKAFEKIQTPAGEFDAFRIESNGWYNGVTWRGAIKAQEIYWYAPKIGRIVRSEYKDYLRGLRNDNVSEIKSFVAAPQ